jgi:hypothetical protein
MVFSLRITAFFLFFLFFVQLPSLAQSSRFEIGAHTSAFIYQGDLTPSPIGSTETTDIGFGLFGSVKLLKPLYLRLNYEQGSLSGDDSKYAYPTWRRERNYKFNTPISEVSGQLVLNLIDIGNIIPNVNLTPYVLGGFGVAFINIERDYSQTRMAPIPGLEADLKEELPGQIAVGLAGGGLRYAITQSVALNVEGSYRFASFTDYLDGFSEAGNPNMDDHYYITSIGLIYSIPAPKFGGRRNKGSICPAYR